MKDILVTGKFIVGAFSKGTGEDLGDGKKSTDQLSMSCVSDPEYAGVEFRWTGGPDIAPESRLNGTFRSTKGREYDSGVVAGRFVRGADANDFVEMEKEEEARRKWLATKAKSTPVLGQKPAEEPADKVADEI